MIVMSDGPFGFDGFVALRFFLLEVLDGSIATGFFWGVLIVWALFFAGRRASAGFNDIHGFFLCLVCKEGTIAW